MANPKYKMILVLFLMYPGGNLTLKREIILPFIPPKKLWLELSTDEEDEDDIVFVKDIKYNIVLDLFEIFCDELTYLNKENAEKDSLYYINTLNFNRTK